MDDSARQSYRLHDLPDNKTQSGLDYLDGVSEIVNGTYADLADVCDR
jgi:hypothetical protein